MYKCLLALLMVLLVIILGNSGAKAENDFILPSSVTIIEKEAFYGDESIHSVVLPGTIKEIHSLAFANCSLREIYLPSSLTYIADDAFSGTDLQSVTVGTGTYAYDWAVRNGYKNSVHPIEMMVSFVEYETAIEAGGEAIWEVWASGGVGECSYSYVVYRDGEVYYTDESDDTYFSVPCTVEADRDTPVFYFCKAFVTDSEGNTAETISPTLAVYPKLQVQIDGDHLMVDQNAIETWRVNVKGGSGQSSYDYSVVCDGEVYYSAENVSEDTISIPLTKVNGTESEYECTVTVYDPIIEKKVVAKTLFSTYVEKSLPLTAPTGVTAMNVLPDGNVFIQWNPVEGATGYMIYYYIDDLEFFIQIDGGDTRNYTIEDSFFFAPGQEVRLHVCAMRRTVIGPESETMYVTIEQTETVTGAFQIGHVLCADAGSSNYVEFNAEINNGTIHQMFLTDENNQVLWSSEETSCVGWEKGVWLEEIDSRFTEAGTYTVKLRIESGTGKMYDAAVLTVQLTAKPVPDYPQSVSAVAHNEGITVNWNQVEESDGYCVHYGSETQFITDSSTLSYTIPRSSLDAGTVYTIYVSAYNEAGTSDVYGKKTVTVYWSGEIVLTRISITSEPGSMLIGTSYQLQWNVVPSNATNKTVHWYSDDSEIVSVDEYTGVMYAVGVGNAYISARSDDGTLLEETEVEVYRPRLSTPTLKSASNTISPEGIQLTWNASKWTNGQGEIYYRVFRNTKSSGTYTEIINGLTSTSFTDTGLQQGTTYYYKIESYGYETTTSSTIKSSKSSYKSCEFTGQNSAKVTFKVNGNVVVNGTNFGTVAQGDWINIEFAEMADVKRVYIRFSRNSSANPALTFAECPSGDIGVPYGSEYYWSTPSTEVSGSYRSFETRVPFSLADGLYYLELVASPYAEADTDYSNTDKDQTKKAHIIVSFYVDGDYEETDEDTITEIAIARIKTQFQANQANYPSNMITAAIEPVDSVHELTWSSSNTAVFNPIVDADTRSIHYQTGNVTKPVSVTLSASADGVSDSVTMTVYDRPAVKVNGASVNHLNWYDYDISRGDLKLTWTVGGSTSAHEAYTAIYESKPDLTADGSASDGRLSMTYNDLYTYGNTTFTIPANVLKAGQYIKLAVKSYGISWTTVGIHITKSSVDMESIMIAGDASFQLPLNSSMELHTSYAPESATNTTINWRSSNVDVVKVTGNGSSATVTAIGSGTARITAYSASDPNVEDYVVITVPQPEATGQKVELITVNGSTNWIASNQSMADVVEFTANVFPESAVIRSVTWSADSSAINIGDRMDGSIYITSNHVNSPTTVTIKASANDGSGKYGTASITVYDRPTIRVNDILLEMNTSSTSFDINSGDLVFSLSAGNENGGYDYNVLMLSEKPSFENDSGTNLNGSVIYDATAKTLTVPAAALAGKTGSYVKVGVKPKNYPTGWMVSAVRLVSSSVNVDSISLSSSTVTLEINENAMLAVSVMPENATIKAFSWVSSNTEIVSVSNNQSSVASIKAIAAGTATITVTATDNSGNARKATCKITVNRVSTPPNAVENVNASVENNCAAVNWSESINASSYSIYMSTTPNPGEAACIISDIPQGTLNARIEKLAAGMEYYFWVVAVKDGQTAWSQDAAHVQTENVVITTSGYFIIHEEITNSLTVTSGSSPIEVTAIGEVANGCIDKMTVTGQLYGTTETIPDFVFPTNTYSGSIGEDQELSFTIDPGAKPFNTPGEYLLKLYVRAEDYIDTAKTTAATLLVKVESTSTDARPELEIIKTKTHVSGRNDESERLEVWYTSDAEKVTLQMKNSLAQGVPIRPDYMDNPTDGSPTETDITVGGLYFRIPAGTPSGMYTMELVATYASGQPTVVTYPFSVRRTVQTVNLSREATLEDKFEKLSKVLPNDAYWNIAGNTKDIAVVTGFGDTLLVTLSDKGCASGHHSMAHVRTANEPNIYYTCNYEGETGDRAQCAGWVRLIGRIIGGRAFNPADYGKNIEAVDTLEAGDIIRYDGHSILVTSVNGDEVVYTDCNSGESYSNVNDGCKIRWGARTTKTKIKQSANFKYVCKYTDYRLKESGEEENHTVLPSEWLQGQFEYLKQQLPEGKGWHAYTKVEVTYTDSSTKTEEYTLSTVELVRNGKVRYTTQIANKPHLKIRAGQNQDGKIVSSAKTTGECGSFYLNGTWMSGQCMGFSEMLGYFLTDVKGRPYHEWQQITSPDAEAKNKYLGQIKPGDVICYKVPGSNNDYGHKIMVLKVENDTIYYVHANGDWGCGISWNGAISRSKMKGYTIKYISLYPGDPEENH